MLNDLINPKHYDGTACAEIGERLTANSYQILKYNWRLGKKDDPVIEIGKAQWYLNREIELGQLMLGAIPSDEWFYERYKAESDYVQAICMNLVSWTRYHDKDSLRAVDMIMDNQLKKLKEG